MGPGLGAFSRADRGIGGRGFSRVAAAFSSYDGDLSLPLELALGSPIFPSGCEGSSAPVLDVQTHHVFLSLLGGSMLLLFPPGSALG